MLLLSYLLDIAKDTWEKFRTGIGIFTMQGFERINKESKNILKRFTNGKGNVSSQSLKQPWDLFYHKSYNMQRTIMVIIQYIIIYLYLL